MASFDHTADLERALLHIFTTNIIMSRMYIHRVRDDFFTSNERKFIFSVANRVLTDTKSLLTHTVFDYEVRSRVEERDQKFFISEWNIIAGIDNQEPPETLIKKIQDAIVGRKAMSLANDVVIHLEAGNIEEAVAHLKREAMLMGMGKETKPLRELTDYQHRLQLIRDKVANPKKYLGIKTGFKAFDRRTGGLFKGELTLIAGVTGLGKSTLCKQLEYGIITHQENEGKNVLHIANEEYIEQVENKFDALITGIPYLNFKLAKMEDESIQKWERDMTHEMKRTGMGRIFTKEVPAFTDVTLIEQAYRELENQGIHIDVIVIDHLPHIKPIQQAWGENDERAKAATDCKELARWLHCAVVIPTQAATDVEAKQTQGKRAGKLDVYGSKGQIHVANTFIIITSKGTDETQTGLKEYERDVYWLVDVKKNRDGPPFWFKVKHLVNCGRVIEVPDEASDNITKDETAEANKAIDEGATEKVSGKDSGKKKDSEKKVPAKVEPKVDPTATPIAPEASAQINDLTGEVKVPAVPAAVVLPSVPSMMRHLKKVK